MPALRRGEHRVARTLGQYDILVDMTVTQTVSTEGGEIEHTTTFMDLFQEAISAVIFEDMRNFKSAYNYVSLIPTWLCSDKFNQRGQIPSRARRPSQVAARTSKVSLHRSGLHSYYCMLIYHHPCCLTTTARAPVEVAGQPATAAPGFCTSQAVPSTVSWPLMMARLNHNITNYVLYTQATADCTAPLKAQNLREERGEAAQAQ